jgi:NAD(P)-dependent dehydrogenase (short-subunit alcohol dehydrogenase family)
VTACSAPTTLSGEAAAVSEPVDPRSLKGRTMLVSGGTTGIGFATALAFAREGANIVLLSLGEDAMASACGQIEDLLVPVLGIVGDVTVAAGVEDAVARACRTFGGLDFAFNCAGIPQAANRLEEQTEAEFERIMDIDVKGVWLSMRYEIPAIIASGGGAIVNAASAVGLRGFAQQGIYCGAKHAVVGLTRGYALDHAAEGIRINAVAPGAVNTEMIKGYAAANAEAWPGILARRPMGVLAEPDEVARAVLFLCRDATNTTGSVLPVDGGLLV